MGGLTGAQPDRSAGVCLTVALVSVLSCRNAEDRAFAGVQERGRVAMGVDQYTSSHRFEPLPDGGRIVLRRDVDDPAGVARIREHMSYIAGDSSEERPACSGTRCVT